MPYSPEEVARRENIIRQYKRGDLSSKRAAQLLACTPRQVRRMLKILTERGTLAHGRIGHDAANRMDETIEAAILRTFDANPRRNNQQIADILSEADSETNRMAVQRVLLRHGRRAEPQLPKAYERFERDEIGAVVYQDTSDHEWCLGSGVRVKCIANQDDHSRQILFARFFRHDGVWPNMIALRFVVENSGVPQTFFC